MDGRGGRQFSLAHRIRLPFFPAAWSLLQDLVSPVVLGMENLPAIGSKDWSRPMLFVGNHGKVGSCRRLAGGLQTNCPA